MGVKILINRKKTGLPVVLAAGILLLSGCGAAKAPVDGFSSASQTFYQESSLDQPELWSAIGDRKGGCTIATVNEDGSPNMIVAVPG